MNISILTNVCGEQANNSLLIFLFILVRSFNTFFSNDELVVFARSYANELGYEIDEMAILALHNRISNIEKLDQATTLVEVKEIIDEAIEREARGGIRKAFNILTAKRYTDDDKIVLTEKDFE